MSNPVLRKNILATLLGSLAFLLMLLISIPVIPTASFLKYDPSGFILLMSGAMLGPGPGVLSCFIKGFLYFIAGAGNIFGVTSDFIANIAFLLPAALLIRRNPRGLKLGIGACVLGTVVSALVMIPVNLVILKLELGLMPGQVMAMMLPAILPFNLAKGGLNTALYMAAGRPLSLALERHTGRGRDGNE